MPSLYLKYRKDVIDNPEMQKKYKEATGKELKVPTTWKEYGLKLHINLNCQQIYS